MASPTLYVVREIDHSEGRDIYIALQGAGPIVAKLDAGLGRESQRYHACRLVRAANAEPELIQALKALLRKIELQDKPLSKDHACAECVPGEDIPEAWVGFRCGLHQALALVAKVGGGDV